MLHSVRASSHLSSFEDKQRTVSASNRNVAKGQVLKSAMTSRTRDVFGTLKFSGRRFASVRRRSNDQRSGSTSCSLKDDSLTNEFPLKALSVELEEGVELQSDLWAWRKEIMWRLLAFVIPAASITLADPLMSLVDNVCIGQFGTTIELAALGPNTVVFNFTSYFFFSIGLATNTLVGRCLRAGRPGEAGRVVTQAMLLSMGIGTLLLGILQLYAPAIIALTGTSANVIPAAVDYLRIRALACPVVLPSITAQAGLLAQKNSVRPSIAVIVAAVTNIALDVFLIKYADAGIRGAAVATVVGQYLSFCLLLTAYFKRDAAVRFTLTRFSLEHITQFGSCVGPIFMVIAAKNLTYLMIQSSATSLHFLLVAAHQALWSLWALCTFCCTPWEQAALAFIPSAKSSREKEEIGRMLIAGSVCFGIIGGLVCVVLPSMAPQLLTLDRALWPAMHSLMLPAFCCMVLVGADVAVSGILLAENQVAYLARAMVVNLAVTSVYLFTKGRSGSLPAVWWGLVIFFFCRASQGIARIVVISSQKDSDENLTENYEGA